MFIEIPAFTQSMAIEYDTMMSRYLAKEFRYHDQFADRIYRGEEHRTGARRKDHPTLTLSGIYVK